MTECYGFNDQTRRYSGPVDLPISIFDPVNQKAAPANTLPFAPPDPAENQVVLVNEARTDWELVSDYTGTAYNKATGEQVEHKELGELPDHLTQKKPTSQWDKWSQGQGKWETDTTQRGNDLRERYCNTIDKLADQTRQRFLPGGKTTLVEYTRVAEQAQAFKKAGYQGEPPMGIASHMRRYEVDAETAVSQILEMAEEYNEPIDQIRDLRFDAKTAIEAMTDEKTEAEFQAEFENWHTQLDAITPSH
ncbi:tail fiber assembly protein [Sansalvadorimonas verongulae]|uniref:tail fiber assembly protein n=1 Tax=Sansalvadorimonas verongulae TaxID=2172824 RepID=UPI0012BCF696|nr:hypothetical protein [Sansalvadorimonas verongulae]MTI13374.1 hypothetical protein [Sansalvadorimonas verongulae]